MSSKFFTWTKGDRRTTVDAYRGAGGLVPIEGLESARSAKVKPDRQSYPLRSAY